MKNRHLISYLLVFAFAISGKAEYSISEFKSRHYNERILYNYYEDQVIERLQGMNTIVSKEIDEDVLDQVRRYVLNDRNGSKTILNRGELYFPLIERILFDNNLPFQLRSLAALESALNPKASSYAGAAGLWQLMPETARNYGLRLNKNIDERLDPVSSTKAAVNYLKNLYEMFGDWTLVLAAYNCGENKIKNLLEEHNTSDYNLIKKYLPRQTQLFIPTFLGVSYMLEFYGEHNLIPEDGQFGQDHLTYVKLDRPMALNKLFKETRINKEVFQTFNPSLKQNEVSHSENGYYISLPDSLMVDLVEYYLTIHKDKVEISHEVESAYGMLISEIITFSRPLEPTPAKVQKEEHERIHYNSTSYADISKVPATRVEDFNNYHYHILRSGESLLDLTHLYENVSLDDLMDWNHITENDNIPVGKVLVIKS